MSRRAPRRVTFDGTLWGGVAEAVALPAALVAAAFLTRQFGPGGYGAYALAVALVVWVEGNVAAFMGRATVRFVSAEGGAGVETTALRLFLAAGVVASAAVFASAGLVAGALDVPEVEGYLRVLAVSPALTALTKAHEFVLVGRRRYRPRALMRAVYWVSRLGLVLALVLGGLGVEGALVAILGATALALGVGRVWARPSLFGPAVPVRPVLRYAVPLLFSGVALRLLKRVDLFALKGFGASVAEAGYYTAAQNLALVPGMVAMAFTPLVLASVGRAVGSGNARLARDMSREALRVPFLLLPFAGVGAGAAPALVAFVYGGAFAPAAPLLGLLLVAGMAGVVVSLGTNILTASGRPRLTTALTTPLVVVVVAALAWAVPRYGAVGAAASTAAVAVAGAAATLAAVSAVLGATLAVGTVLRCLAVTALGYGAGALVPASGPALLVSLLGVAGVLAVVLRLVGALGERDVALVRSLLP